MKRSFLILFFCVQACFTIGQPALKKDKKPKVALVLSGGGAKGFAHIGVIELLEEVGIKPDIITGTSMGAIVGALYSIGYSTDQLKSLAKETEWDEVLNNSVNLNRISIEEKPYYDRYITEFPIEKGKIKLPSALIEGQPLHVLLSELTTSVHGIKRFEDFPIPFNCVAANIETGMPVTLEEGDLAQSLRASMAIPSIFTPVEIGNQLLVDGGLIRNFPVEEAKAMGADIVIGVYVGGRFKPKDQLNSVTSILKQAAFIPSVFDSKQQMKHCDYLILPNDSAYDAMDFNRADTIIATGYNGANKLKQNLIELRKSYELEFAEPNKGVYQQDKYRIDHVEVSGNSYYPSEMVRNKLNIKIGKSYSTKKIKTRIDYIYGSNYFKKVNYTLSPIDSVGYVLTVNIEEAPRNKLKVALHYSNENGFGANVNFTGRNVLAKGSRAMLELDLAENPRADLNYLKYIGKRQNLLMMGRLKVIHERNLLAETITNDLIKDIYIGTQIEASAEIQSTYKTNFALGGGVKYLAMIIKPKFNDSILKRIVDEQFVANGSLLFNTLDRPYYPTKGLFFEAKLRVKLLAATQRTDLGDALRRTIIAAPVEIVESSFSQRYQFSMEKRTPFLGKHTLYFGGLLGINSEEALLSDGFLLGGESPLLFDSKDFWGVGKYQIGEEEMLMLKGGLQLGILQNLYLEGRVNYANTRLLIGGLFDPSLEDKTIDLDGVERKSILGYGIRLATLTMIGPVSFRVSKTEYTDYDFTFSLGFHF